MFCFVSDSQDLLDCIRQSSSHGQLHVPLLRQFYNHIPFQRYGTSVPRYQVLCLGRGTLTRKPLLHRWLLVLVDVGWKDQCYGSDFSSLTINLVLST